MEIRRFGPGYRRPDGPPGTAGMTGQSIWSDERAHISELAFSRHGMITPHSNPNLTLFVVISGGGFVQVGDERQRINHGECVVWPPNVPHGAYTDGVEMRALVIELPEGLGEGGTQPAVQVEGAVSTTSDADWARSGGPPGGAPGSDPGRSAGAEPSTPAAAEPSAATAEPSAPPAAEPSTPSIESSAPPAASSPAPSVESARQAPEPAVRADEPARRPVEPARGSLADRGVARADYDATEGEPW